MIRIAAGSAIYLDSNILIYYIEYKGHLRERAARFLQRATELGARCVISELTVAECLYKPFRENNAAQVLAYRNILKEDFFELMPLTGDLAIRAAEQGSSLGLKLLDAIHYMTALEAGCDLFVTTDKDFQSTQYMEIVTI